MLPFSHDATSGITPLVPAEDLPDVPPGLSVCFYPQRPVRGHWFFHALEVLGWAIVADPDGADWRVLYHLDTEISLSADDPYAAQVASWLNGRCTDISKRRVELDFANVFGYELAIDPTTYRGRCLAKADDNCVKDARVVQCPIPASEIRADQVYERLVDGTQPDGSLLEIRVFVAGGTLPIVRRKLHENWHGEGRLHIREIEVQTLPATAVFSADEIARLLEFSHVAGLDLGCLDVIRDREDGRIYVLDVTKTPGAGGWNSSPRESRERIARTFGAAWFASFPPVGR